MATPATANEPTAEHVQEAVAAIEKVDADLLAARIEYMKQCKELRNNKADEYDNASDRGISKKLLRTKIKERELKAKAAKLTAKFQEDERSEYQMLSEKLGEFADTPLGVAALARADGKGTLAAGYG
jgi:hypothetical protein